MSHLKVLSAGSTLHGLHACSFPAVETLRIQITMLTDHGHNIRDTVLRGGTEIDVVMLPMEMATMLSAKGLVRDAVPLGTVGIGGVVREGSRVPDISTMEKLRTALIEADAVLLTNAPTGDHLMQVIAQLSLAEVVAPKLSRFDTSTKLNEHLATRTDNALGFGPETEIRAGRHSDIDVRWIGSVPDEIQIALPYSAAMVTGTKAADAARAFLDFLTTPPAREAFAKTGVRFS